MKYLIDTHVCLWAIFQKEKLSPSVKIILENPEFEIFISQISLWEIAIKYQIGKLPDFNVSLESFINAISAAGFHVLPLKNEHLVTYFNCSYFNNDHRDPFDRLLIATADTEKANFITKDEKFSNYLTQVPIIW